VGNAPILTRDLLGLTEPKESQVLVVYGHGTVEAVRTSDGYEPRTDGRDPINNPSD